MRTDADRTADRRRYQANKARRLESARKWRAKNPDVLAEYYMKRHTSAERRAYHLYMGAKKRASQNGLAFTISREWLEEKLRAGVCEVSGIALDLSPSPAKYYRRPNCPSLDQIVAGDGYSPENCRVICFALNAAFGSWGEDYFRPIADAWIKKGMI